jgi:hypothetical protein
VREWQYWTRNKLEILAGYLPAFNLASKRSEERLYIDLMAGEPVNRERTTGEAFDGSARIALSAQPPFTRLVFCEVADKAPVLATDLRQRFPDRKFRVYPGDCNVTIDRILADLNPWRWAPTFVFADQIPVAVLALVAGMVPAPGEAPADWPANTGFDNVMRQQAQRYAGQDLIYHDVPPALAGQARRRSRDQSDTPGRAPWPLRAWPPVPARFVLCTGDRFFPPEFMRRVVADRLGIVPDEIAAGHAAALSRPRELASLLASYAPISA